MSPEEQKRIASMGGRKSQANGNAHRFTKEEAQSAGRKGGAIIAAVPGRMAEIGRMGGLSRGRNRKGKEGS